MNRRDTLFSLLALSSTVFPRQALGQDGGKPRRIGYLSLEPAEPTKGSPSYLIDALREIGYEEGKNIVIESRWGNRSIESLPALAAELVNRNVELIVAFSNAEAIAVKRATKTIPIVLLWGSAPVEDGLVASLTHPGGNLTGTTYFEPILLTRSFQFLREAKPSARRVAVVGPASYIGYREGMDAVARSAPSLGIQLGYFDVTYTRRASRLSFRYG